MDINELKIISEISKNGATSQRELSQRAELSLGLVNIILRRLLEKGYMKMKQLNGRKVQYFLTPKGFAEKIERSREYLYRTISSLSEIINAIKKMIVELVDKGENEFYLLGDGELAFLTEFAIKQFGNNNLRVEHINSINDASALGGIILIVGQIDLEQAKKLADSKSKYFDVSKKIAEIII